MTNQYYGKLYDLNFNVECVFDTHQDYYEYVKLLPIKSYIIEFSEKDNVFDDIDKWYYIGDDYHSHKLDDWFREMGWNPGEGFNTDEKKTLFKLKFL